MEMLLDSEVEQEGPIPAPGENSPCGGRRNAGGDQREVHAAVGGRDVRRGGLELVELYAGRDGLLGLAFGPLSGAV